MGTISGLIGPLQFLRPTKSLIEFSEKTILLISIQVIFGFNKFLETLSGINL